VNIEAVRRDRDQLWAEAVHRYEAGEPWWLSPADEALAKVEQEDHREPDPWEEDVLACITATSDFSVSDVLGRLGFTLDQRDVAKQRRVAKVLRALHCEHKKVNGRMRWRPTPATWAMIASDDDGDHGDHGGTIE
jgi:predicted P-loop ATPase